MRACISQRLMTVGVLLCTTMIVWFLVSMQGCDDDDSLDAVGQPCKASEDCYPLVEHADLSGDVICMDRVEDGYCTHHCKSDADCCAAEGECDDALKLEYVCGPFESTGEMYCFVSCEGQEDGNAYCQENAHREFICRSTGGGNKNRKVCVPEG